MANAKARTNLKLFRTALKMTQEELAAVLGCNRGTYAAIENGARNGRTGFWLTLKEKYPNADIGELMKVDND